MHPSVVAYLLCPASPPCRVTTEGARCTPVSWPTTTLRILPPPPPQSNYGGRKMHPSVIAYLREFYRPSVHDLYRLLGRDLGWEGFGSTAGSVLPGTTFGSGGGDGSGGKSTLPQGVHQRWAGTMPQLSGGGPDG